MRVIRLAVSGALGKMGQRILALAAQDPAFDLALALERPDHPQLGSSALGLRVTGDIKALARTDGLIDFSSPAAARRHAAACARAGIPLVVGTTGLGAQDIKALRAAAKKIPVVFSPNMSAGVNVVFRMAALAAAALPGDYAIHIKETHHIHKKDAPSGTAKRLAEIIMARRPGGNVPIASLREGEVIGEHVIVFEGPADTITLTHSAKSRDIFVLGALEAMKFCAKKKRGLYDMGDVLGLKTSKH
ncbi:MAG: 4-hydroxy-tetrahydrodipicolinate reductase [Deltaproteobacteria bacterium]